MGTTTGEVILDDGSRIEFEWVYPGAESYAWTLDDEHHPGGCTPMQHWIEAAGVAGHDRAWDEVGLVQLAVFRRFQQVGPFHYARATMEGPDEMGRVLESLGQLMERHADATRFWEDWCEPRIRAACDRLAVLPDDVPLADVADDHEYALHQTFTSILPLYMSWMPLRFMLDAAGVDGIVLAQQATQGGANASQAIDADVVTLAAALRAEPALAVLAASGSAGDALTALRREPAARPFLEQFDGFVERHAARSIGWDLHAPTWGERPDHVLALVRAHLAGDAVAPDEAQRRSTVAKADALAVMLAALPPEQHEQCLAMVRAAEGQVAVREGRAYWQMVLTGRTRQLLLRRGDALVRAGRIDRADDVLWLVPEEFETSAADHRAVVAARRREWERLTALRPPPQVGTPSPEHGPPRAEHDGELRGFAGSRGRVTATARVLGSVDEADRFQPGEVLVCAATSPAWTPLFALAAAVVTESGGATSHAAITAREYAIPAVLSVRGACTTLVDGSTVTVDGTNGTVTPAS